MRILHLLDASAGWEQRVAITQLLARLGHGEDEQIIATIDRETEAGFRLDDRPLTVLPRRMGLPVMAGPAVRSHCIRYEVDLIHAWGVDAAAAGRAAFPDGRPMAVTVFDPGLSKRRIRMLRTIGRDKGFGVICATERVRRCLVERGVPLEQCVLLRPGVDFAVISGIDRAGLKAELNLPKQGLTVVTIEPRPGDDGHYAAVWSVLMRWYLDDGARIIVPGDSPETRALRGLAEGSESPHVLVPAGRRRPFEQLCALADFLVIGSTGDIPTTAIAWAMAASTPVISPATYSTTEMLANNLNGVLFKASPCWRRRGARICALYAQTPDLAMIKEVARTQAYEVFSLRRHIHQQRQVYDNLSRRLSPSMGITDPAMVA